MNELKNNFLVAFTQNTHLLILTIVLVLVAGLSAFITLPRIEDPRITTRNATIITPFPGASPPRVEALVTKKIEDRLRELSEIKNIESTSRSGISVVSIELQDWITAKTNEQILSKVRDRLTDAVGELPSGAGVPEFDDKRGAVAYSMILSLSWNQPGATKLGILNRLAESLGDRLRNLPGTEEIVFFGAPSEEIRVDVDPEELAALGLTPADLAQRVSQADARRSAGTVRDNRGNLPLELTGALDSLARVASIPLADNGRGAMVYLGDIAKVHKTWADPPEQIALHNGQRTVLLAVRTEENIRLDQWADSARTAVNTFRSNLDSGIMLETVFDQSRYTEERLGNLGGNLIAGAVIVMVVVLLTMGWRSALIVGSALPLSAGATLFGLTFFNVQIHQMTIFGMIIALGLLIDNAIVMTDQVSSRRRRGLPPSTAVADAIRHLFSPLFASTFTTVLGFMPVFLLPGNVGDFVGPIAIAVVLALIASFLLSITVIPALAGLLAEVEYKTEHPWWRHGVENIWLDKGYRSLLRYALDYPTITLTSTAVFPVLGFILAGTLGMQFFPPADRDQIEVQLWLPSGTGIYHTAERLRDIEGAIREQAGIKDITWVAGGSSPPVYYNQLRNQDNNPVYARGVIHVADAGRAKTLESLLQEELIDRFSDAQIVVKAFGQGPPIKSPVGFRIIGPDPDQLRLLGEQVRAVMQQRPEITYTQASIQGGEPKLWLAANESQAQLAGLTLSGIAEQFQTALDGRVGGRVLEDLEDLPVRIRHASVARTSLDKVSTLSLNAPGGDSWIPAIAIGELTLRPELTGITRRNGERVNEIQGYLRQGALPIEVTRTVMTQLDSAAMKLPAGYRIEVAGDSAEQQQAISQLLTYAPVLATLMITSLVLSFRSFALAGLIGIVAILSGGLGMLSLWVGGYPLGFNPIIGSAGLIGVAINGGIVVLAAIRANPQARSGDRNAIIHETLGATRHIVSTTLTTVAGFMPLLVFSGGDFWPPLAVVIAGGVGMSIILSLLFTPIAYSLMARWIGAHPQRDNDGSMTANHTTRNVMSTPA